MQPTIPSSTQKTLKDLLHPSCSSPIGQVTEVQNPALKVDQNKKPATSKSEKVWTRPSKAKPKKSSSRASVTKVHRVNDALRPELHSIRNWVHNLKNSPATTPQTVLVHLSLSFDILAHIPEILKEAHIVTYSQKPNDPENPALLKGHKTHNLKDTVALKSGAKFFVLYNVVRNLSKEQMKVFQSFGLPILCITKTSRTKKSEQKNVRNAHLGKLTGLYNRVQALGVTHLYTTVTNPESAHPSILNPAYSVNAKPQRSAKPKDSKRQRPAPARVNQTGQRKDRQAYTNNRKPQRPTQHTNKAQIETLYAGQASDAKATIQVQKRTRVTTAAQPN